MPKIVLASHGLLAKGMKNSIEIIMGPTKNLELVTAYIDDIDPEVEAEKIFNNLNQDETLIVVTDLFGGSVNNVFLNYINKENFYLISGMTLALVLQLLMIKEDENIEENIIRLIDETKDHIVLCNDLLKEYTEEEGEF